MTGMDAGLVSSCISCIEQEKDRETGERNGRMRVFLKKPG